MRRNLPLIVALSIAACGGDDGPLSVDELPDETVASVCAAQVRCGAFPDLASCLAATQSNLDVDGLDADINAGVVDYDGAAARDCLDQFGIAFDCELSLTGDRLRELEEVCAGIFSGTIADGEVCTEDEQCAGLFAACQLEACPDQCCSGTCLTPPAEAAIGESCATADCAVGAFCDDTDTCAARAGSGEACTSFDSCVDGSLCDIQGSGTCVPLSGPGEACDPAGVFGLSCLRTDNYCDLDTQVCSPRLEADAACDEQQQNCLAFATCTGGVCVARPGLGDSCVVDVDDCLGGLDCIDGTCDFEDTAADPYCPLGG